MNLVNNPRAKIIGLGKKGKNIIDEIRVDINLPEYLLIDDTETINVDKEHEIVEFINASDVIRLNKNILTKN